MKIKNIKKMFKSLAFHYIYFYQTTENLKVKGLNIEELWSYNVFCLAKLWQQNHNKPNWSGTDEYRKSYVGFFPKR